MEGCSACTACAISALASGLREGRELVVISAPRQMKRARPTPGTPRHRLGPAAGAAPPGGRRGPAGGVAWGGGVFGLVDVFGKYRRKRGHAGNQVCRSGGPLPDRVPLQDGIG